MSLRSQSNKRTYEELPTDDSDLEIIFEKKDKSNSRSNGSKSNSSNKKKTNSKNISNSNSNSKSSSNSNNIKTSGKKDKSSTKDNDGDSVASVAEELIVEKILGRKLVTTKVVEHSNNANTNTSNDNSYSNSNSYGDSYVPSSETVTVTEELFYIKWKGLSYLHSSWEKREDIEAVDPNGKTKIKRFLQTPQHPRIFGEARPKSSDSDRDSDDDDYSDYEVGDAVDYFNPEFVDIHRVISCDTILTRHAEVKVAVELLEVPSAKVSKSIQAKGSASSNSITNDIDRNADAEDVDPDDEVQYLVKWRGQSYGECTWEKWKDIKEHYEEVFNFWQRERIGKATKKIPRRPNVEEYRALTTSPVYGLIAEDTKEKYLKEKEQTGLLLREYQLEGLNWLLWNWFHKRSCILADEMGLGKTIQTIAFLHQLRTHPSTKLNGPFLIVAPLSLVDQWQSEINTWSPSLNCVLLHGSMEAREIIVEHELYYREPFINGKDAASLKKTGIYKFNILLTTYEMAVKEIRLLCRINWQVMIIDEAHRLKNQTSQLFKQLATIPHGYCVLLTGTPLQNRTEELWALLNFANREKFSDQEEFMEKFGDLKEASQVAHLHEVLRPYLLRRIKEDVEKSLPPKEETIVEVALTSIQKQFYRAIYEKNTTYLFKGLKSSNQPSLMNVMMELRKCCNHPYLVRGVEERVLAELTPEEKENPSIVNQKLIHSCGKLVLLDKLLPRLHSEGHKVLIFSQMVRVLNLLEDFLKYKGYSFERLDGSTSSQDRKEAVAKFCSPEKERFIMLLSTKAGGLGLNLTAADTVIIFDSDWNPQNDLQAQARAHRIGQTKAVMVYRLLTKKTYEMEMFHQASMKLGLDRAVLAHARNEQDDFDWKDKSKASKKAALGPGLSAKEIDELLKRGAYDVFREDDTEQKEFLEEDIDAIMQRRSHKIVYDQNAIRNLASSLGSFSKASFVSADEKEDVDINDPDFWKKAIGLTENMKSGLLDDEKEDEVLPSKRISKQTKVYGESQDWNDKDYKEVTKPPKTVKAPKMPRIPSSYKVEREMKKLQREELIRLEREAKMRKALEEAQIKNDPRNWGSHCRDRILRALNFYGFSRWERVRIESGSTGIRDLRAIEEFARAYVLQCGLCAARQELTKNDSAFVRDAIASARAVLEMVESGERTLAIPPALLEPRFIAKLKAGVAKKVLNKLDVLAKLINIMQKVCDSAYAAKGLMPNQILLENIDAWVATLTQEELVQFLPLGDVRPQWTRLREWWDLECDAHLLIGVFRHGYGRYDLIRKDPSLIFHSKLKACVDAGADNIYSFHNPKKFEDEPSGSALMRRVKSDVSMNGTDNGSSYEEDPDNYRNAKNSNDNYNSSKKFKKDQESNREEVVEIDINDNDDQDDREEDIDEHENENQEDGSIALPDARTINRLLSWLISSDGARITREELREKQRQLKRIRAEEAQEKRVIKAKLKQLHESTDARPMSISDGLFDTLDDYLDLEAIGTVYDSDVDGLKQCQEYLRSPMIYNEELLVSNDIVCQDLNYLNNGASSCVQESSSSNGSGESSSGNPMDIDEDGVIYKSDMDKHLSAQLVNETEAMRLSCTFVLFGAPHLIEDTRGSFHTDSNVKVPLVVLEAIGMPPQSLDQYNLLTTYSWDKVIQYSGVNRSVDIVKEFYVNVWLPFCGSAVLRKVPSVITSTQFVIPNPCKNLTELHLATKGLCQLFLIRQKILKTIQYLISEYCNMIIAYLRSPSGRKVSFMPSWWCPWIHDLALLVGIARHGYFALNEIVHDKNLPFTREHVEKHIRKVFIDGSSIMAPQSLGELHSREEQEEFVATALLLFPDYRVLELRVMRIVEDILRLVLEDQFSLVQCCHRIAPILAQDSIKLQVDEAELENSNTNSRQKYVARFLQEPSVPLRRYVVESKERRRRNLMETYSDLINNK